MTMKAQFYKKICLINPTVMKAIKSTTVVELN
jgi:hypothetical protein